MRIIPTLSVIAAAGVGVTAAILLRPEPVHSRPPALATAATSGVEMFGGSPARNMVNLTEKHMPTEWDVQAGTNIKWKAKVGSRAYAAHRRRRQGLCRHQQ